MNAETQAEGYFAALEGDTVNPYPDNTPEYRNWQIGYNAGVREDLEEENEEAPLP